MKKNLATALLMVIMLSGCNDVVATIGFSSQQPTLQQSASKAMSSQGVSSTQKYSSSKASSQGISSMPQPTLGQSSYSKPLPVGLSSKASSSLAALQQQPIYDDYSKKLISLIYEGVQAGPQQKKYIYNVNKYWDSTVYNYSYDTGGQAHLSWKVSYILEGLDYAYRATKDKYFLDESVEMYDALLQVRDDKLGRQAWNGTVYPLWGSTSRYNGSRFVLSDDNGAPLAELKFNCQGNDETFVMVNKNASDGSFDLSIKYGNTEYKLNSLTLDTLIERISSEINWTYYGSPNKDKKVIEVKLLTNDYTLLPVTQDYIRTENTNVPTVVHTAMILEPMVNTYLEMKKTSHPQTNEYKNEINIMIDCVLNSMWDEKGYFKDFENSPTHLGGGKILPWNQQLPLVAAMANFAISEKNDEYKLIVGAFCKYFLSNIEKTDAGYLWKYWNEPNGNVAYNETTNYSGIDINSIYSIHKTGLGFSKADIDQFGLTISKRILKNPQNPATRVDGSSPNAANTKLLYKLLAIPAARAQIISINKNADIEWHDAARMLYYYNNYDIS